jgi:hypothetical protein
MSKIDIAVIEAARRDGGQVADTRPGSAPG